MKKNSILVQGSYEPKNGEPRVLPLSQSTGYVYDSSEDLAKLFKLETTGHIYSRISNPTVDAVEKKVALLDGGIACLAANSGHAAMINTVLNLCVSGDNLLSSSKIYGGVYNLFCNTLPLYGITTKFFDPNASEEDIVKLCDKKTKFIFAESLSNPDVTIVDVKKLSRCAKKIDVPLVIDNTVLTSILYDPIADGANLVLHSASKYMDGHASVLGGFIVDAGTFNYNNGKFPKLVDPDPSYNNISYHEKFKELAFIVKARTHLVRDLGNYLSANSAYMINMHLETLHLRMERHSSNALALAKYLEQHKDVAWVKYPGLKSHPQYDLSKDMLHSGFGGMLSIGVKGGRAAGEKLTNNLKLARIVAHFGDTRSCVIHPASTTHSQLTDKQLVSAGALPNLIRVSVGLEDIEDIIADFDQAFKGL